MESNQSILYSFSLVLLLGYHWHPLDVVSGDRRVGEVGRRVVDELLNSERTWVPLCSQRGEREKKFRVRVCDIQSAVFVSAGQNKDGPGALGSPEQKEGCS